MPNTNMHIHTEWINLLSSVCFDLNFAKVGIKTEEKIIADMPVTIAGIESILKYISISADAPKVLAKTIWAIKPYTARRIRQIVTSNVFLNNWFLSY